MSLPCEAARRERVLEVSSAAVAAVVVSSVAEGAAVVSSVAEGAAVVSASVVASAVVVGAAAVVVASAAVADTSSAATAFVAKIVVPNKTEHTPIVNLRNEKRWRLLKISFIWTLPFLFYFVCFFTQTVTNSKRRNRFHTFYTIHTLYKIC